MPVKPSPRTPKNCSRFAPGHTPHWVQVLGIWRSDEARRHTRRCRVIDVGEDDISIELDDRTRIVLLNHETPRLVVLSPPIPFFGRYNPRNSLLLCPPVRTSWLDGESAYAFSVLPAEGGPLGPCTPGSHE